MPAMSSDFTSKKLKICEKIACCVVRLHKQKTQNLRKFVGKLKGFEGLSSMNEWGVSRQA